MNPLTDNQRRLQDHEKAQLINQLTGIAKKYHNHQSLRERIANVIRPLDINREIK